MAAPYVSKLGSVTTANNTTSIISFTLPSTTLFAHLWIVGWVKAGNNSNYTENLKLSLNADTTAANYTAVNYYQTATSGAPTAAAFNNYVVSSFYGFQGNSYVFSPLWIWIPNYRSSTYKMSVSGSSIANNDATLGYGKVGLNTMQWKSTAAITSLDFTSGSGSNFDTYTNIIVYGVKDN